MKNRFLLISLCLLLFAGCNNNTVSTGLPAGASKQIQIDGTNICYSVNVLDVNSHYVEVEISAFYDDDYYFEDQAQHNLFDSTMGYYDLAILGDDIISSCEIGGVEIPLSCYAGGVFYGNKQAYAVLIGKENPTKIKLNFSTKQYSAS